MTCQKVIGLHTKGKDLAFLKNPGLPHPSTALEFQGVQHPAGEAGSAAELEQLERIMEMRS